eukprot:5384533-Ditylum_brightwellii.AAC.1
MDELQDKNHELVLSLDANEDTLEAGPFQNFIEDNDLTDVYKHLHQNLHLATYLRGHRRLDYVFISP